MNVKAAIEAVKPYTKTSQARLEAMAAALKRIDELKISGDVVECGVWRGGNIILARMLAPERVCWLYDTFTGMHNPGRYDITRKGSRIDVGKSAVALDAVVANLAETGTLDLNKLRFVSGPVESTLRGSDLPQQIALLRLDTDWYQSTKVELEVLWPRVSKEGVMIVDDYWHWQGARKAVDEFFYGRWPVKNNIDKAAIMVVKRLEV